MIVGIGVDVVEVARLATALERTPSLRGRLFTSREQQLTSLDSLAARFAAKEAVAKALQTTNLPWVDAEIVSLADGRPVLELHGRAAEVAAAQGISSWHVSLSHDGGIATAMVIAES